ncbi:hypothetical protein NLK61_20495 [Pseudomonas fuscovaginae UPB0736]|uniref:hypothetical protein n=1 Tax=Pseudomonas asplenii TaxID=53407 RepID=UPI0012FC0FA6|nr:MULTISPECIES: hypothetical protein [Pseudomonas]UUQ63620.1 hypothetical protein NLK61_20495 [Pseudomonas fuscovaginae UPB0736]UZE27881.1 hypothetical protein LOY63_21385 [Pseudomonas asplenii]
MKILINLQVGSVREKLLATPFAIESKAVFAQVLPGNHRGGRSLFSVAGFFEGADQGIYSTRIDFQLGTNEADGSLLSIEREEGFEKKTEDRGRYPGGCPVVGDLLDREAFGAGHSVCRQALFPLLVQKRCADITVHASLVHIIGPACLLVLISFSGPVNACIGNTSQ